MKTILVVDDEPGFVQVLEARFRMHGCDVVTARDGAEARSFEVMTSSQDK